MTDLTDEEKKEISAQFSTIIAMYAKNPEDIKSIRASFNKIIEKHPQQLQELNQLFQQEFEGPSKPILLSSEQTTKLKAQFHWATVKSTFHRVYSGEGVPIKLHTIDDDQNNYMRLQELSSGNVTLKSTQESEQKFQMVRFNDNQLKARELIYNNDGNLQDVNDKKATTDNAVSKNLKGYKAYVFQNGSLYVEENSGEFNQNGETVTHASLSRGARVDLAGLIKIKEGKIIYIDSYSGHYRPDVLEFYKGLKMLQEKMPNAFSTDCEIGYFDSNHAKAPEMSLEIFMNTMGDLLGEEILDLKSLKLDEKRYFRNLTSIETGLAIKSEELSEKSTTPFSEEEKGNFNKLCSNIYKNNLEGVNESLLLLNPNLLDAKNEDDKTPLMLAVENSNMSMVVLLLQTGANPNIKNNTGKTALMISSQMCGDDQDKIITSLLIIAGANIDSIDDNLWKAEDWAKDCLPEDYLVKKLSLLKESKANHMKYVYEYLSDKQKKIPDPVYVEGMAKLFNEWDKNNHDAFEIFCKNHKSEPNFNQILTKQQELKSVYDVTGLSLTVPPVINPNNNCANYLQ
jgi:hypothetical protein